MFSNNALIFYYHRLNSYSFNTLAGAIDSDSELRDIPIGLALTEDRLRKLVEDVLTAVALVRKYGYKVIVDFILGLPGESEKDMQESLKVMQQLVRMGARVHPHVFAPLPQTAFAKKQPGNVSPLVAQAIEEFRALRGIYGKNWVAFY